MTDFQDESLSDGSEYNLPIQSDSDEDKENDDPKYNKTSNRSLNLKTSVRRRQKKSQPKGKW